MRRLKSKQHEEKRQKRNQVIIGLILVFVMFSSVLGYAMLNVSYSDDGTNGNTNSIIYNNLEFTQQNGFWILNQGNTNFIFKNNPNQIPKITSELKPIEEYNGKPLYIYSHDIEAGSEIRTNLFPFVERIQEACFENETCEGDLPIKTCEDNLIVIREGTQGITQENNCVFIQGNENELTELTDGFLFKLLGIYG
jgi:hypothetical protein